MDIKETAKSVIGEYQAVFEKIDSGMIDEFVKLVQSHNRIFFIGVGREGMMTRAFAMRLMHMGKEIHWIWDDTTPSINEGDLLVATIGGGNIGHIRYVCERAKANGAVVAVMTGSPSGKAVKEVADHVLFIPAAVYLGKDEVVPSIQPMGNLFEQCLLITCDLMVMKIVSETPELSFEKMEKRHRNVE
jgi:6-phospho-3-hexuloisomerase